MPSPEETFQLYVNNWKRHNRWCNYIMRFLILQICLNKNVFLKEQTQFKLTVKEIKYYTFRCVENNRLFRSQIRYNTQILWCNIRNCVSDESILLISRDNINIETTDRLHMTWVMWYKKVIHACQINFSSDTYRTFY